jgi:hypothetical protein
VPRARRSRAAKLEAQGQLPLEFAGPPWWRRLKDAVQLEFDFRPLRSLPRRYAEWHSVTPFVLRLDISTAAGSSPVIWQITPPATILWRVVNPARDARTKIADVTTAELHVTAWYERWR